MSDPMQHKSKLIKALALLAAVIPGDYLKTVIYLYGIHKPRKSLRLLLNSFYRMDHVYDVLGEARNKYKGSFSVLEFGVAHGYSLAKLLYATKFLKMTDRVTVHGFDTFEGMPESGDRSDQEVVSGDGWLEGQYKGSYETLEEYCRERYSNCRLHKGLFEDTIDDALFATLERNPPILIWIDCDYYSSTRTVFERLIPHIPNGCVVYFDEPEFNYGSRFTGESRVIHEINKGDFGEGIELLLDTDLSLNSKRVYRFMNINAAPRYELVVPVRSRVDVRRITNGSPLP